MPKSRARLFCLSPSSLLSCIMAYLEMTSSSRLMAKVRFSRSRRANVGSDRAGSMPVWENGQSTQSQSYKGLEAPPFNLKEASYLAYSHL